MLKATVKMDDPQDDPRDFNNALGGIEDDFPPDDILCASHRV